MRTASEATAPEPSPSARHESARTAASRSDLDRYGRPLAGAVAAAPLYTVSGPLESSVV